MSTVAKARAAAAGLTSAAVCSLYPRRRGAVLPRSATGAATSARARDGVPLTRRLQVVIADCPPGEGTRVDVSHCDAQENFRGCAAQRRDAAEDTVGRTFLRGTQVAEARGRLLLAAIYPGWHRGRATHIHFNVFPDRQTVLTGR